MVSMLRPIFELEISSSSNCFSSASIGSSKDKNKSYMTARSGSLNALRYGSHIDHLKGWSSGDVSRFMLNRQSTHRRGWVAFRRLRVTSASQFRPVCLVLTRQSTRVYPCQLLPC